MANGGRSGGRRKTQRYWTKTLSLRWLPRRNGSRETAARSAPIPAGITAGSRKRHKETFVLTKRVVREEGWFVKRCFSP